MKKMMTNMKTLVALLMAGAAVTSCSSDNEMDSLKAPAGKTYTMTVQATKGGDATTRALADGGTTLTSTWSKDDVVEVWSEDGTTTKYGELTATAAGSSTTLTGTLTTAPTDQETLTLKYLSPNYSTHDGTLTGTDNSIDKKCDYATATVTATVDGDKVTTDAATFQHQQAVVKFTLVDKANPETKLSPTALTINDGTSDIVTLTSIPAETYTTNGAGVLYVALPAVSSKPITLTATVGSDTYTLTTSSSKTFTIGNFYRVTAKMTKQAAVPTGALSGQFSVASGKKVYFSKGNLQYIGSANTPYWKFAEHQYDYITTSQNSDATNVDRDLFGWGTSGSAPSGYTARAPYYITHATSNYVSNITTSGTSWGTNSEWDWGHNAISNGGNTADTWRTLTKDEWVYLFQTRIGAGNKYGFATVDGKHGVIIVPDDFTDPMKNNGSGAFKGFSSDTGWDANVYSAEDWSAMETAGCVFLPAAGARFTTTMESVGLNGRYWSSTSNGAGNAYGLGFGPAGANPGLDLYRSYGNSVRLVCPVE